MEHIIENKNKKTIIKDFHDMDINNISIPLKVFTLGRFSIVIDGKPLYFIGKAQHRPLQLLKTLIALGSRDVSKYYISDTLYPEAEGDKAHRSTVTTLHRLRKLIKNNGTIQLQDHKLTLNQHYCLVDVWILESLIKKLQMIMLQSENSDKKNEIPFFAGKILQLYKGDFLRGEFNNSCVWTYRERLRHKILRTISLIGQFWEKRQKWDMAVEIYMRALEADSLAEEFYQRLMICYHKQGFGGEAMSVYMICEKTLSSILGIEPSAKTKAIRDNLFSNGTEIFTS